MIFCERLLLSGKIRTFTKRNETNKTIDFRHIVNPAFGFIQAYPFITLMWLNESSVSTQILSSVFSD